MTHYIKRNCPSFCVPNCFQRILDFVIGTTDFENLVKNSVSRVADNQHEIQRSRISFFRLKETTFACLQSGDYDSRKAAKKSGRPGRNLQP